MKSKMKKISKQKMHLVCWLYTLAAALWFVSTILYLWKINSVDTLPFIYHLLVIAYFISFLLFSVLAIIWWTKYTRVKHLTDEEYNQLYQLDKPEGN